MTSKVIDLQQKRREKRSKTGLTIAEIRQRAARRATINRTIERHEPDNLASGKDMKEILNEVEDDGE